MMDSSEYVRHVLDAYRAASGTCGAIRKPDRAFALQLFARGVPLALVEKRVGVGLCTATGAARRCGSVRRDPVACLLLSGH
jgi:hypothetical protein